MIAGPRLADRPLARGGRRRAPAATPARGSRTSRAARTTAGRSWRACTRRSCPGAARFAPREERAEVESALGPDHRRRRGPGLAGHPAGLRGPGDRRAVPDRRRPAPRLPRRRARHCGRCRTCGTRSCSRSSSGRSSRSPTRSCRRRRSSRRTGTSRRGRGATSGSGRSAAPRASRCPDWEIFASLGARRGRRPRLRDARRAARGDGPAAGAARAETRAAPSPARGSRRTAVPEGSLLLFSYPLLVDEGRLSERADELKAALEDERVRGDPPRATPPTRGVVDGGRAIVRTRRARPSCPVRVTEHIAQGVGVRAVQPAGVRREHDPVGLVHDRRDASSRWMRRSVEPETAAAAAEVDA